MSSIYRRSGAQLLARPAHWDRDLVGFFVLLWIACLVRVVLTVARSEAFGAGSTVALLVLGVVPYALRDSFRSVR